MNKMMIIEKINKIPDQIKLIPEKVGRLPKKIAETFTKENMIASVKKNRGMWYLISVLLTLRYLLPPFFDDILEKHQIIETCIAAVPLLVFIAVVLKDGIRFKVTVIPFIAFYLVYIISTVVNGKSVMSVIVHSAHVLILCVVVDDFFYDKKKADSLMTAVRDITLAFYLINFILTIVYPDGIPEITKNTDFPFFLYNNVNSTIKYVFPGVVCSIILDIRQNKKLSFSTAAFLLGIIENAIRIYFTATAVVAILFIIIWYFAIEIFKGKEKWIYLALLVAVAVFEIVLVINNSQSGALAAIITGIFHKTPDFSNRTRLWNNAIDTILKHPIIGWGLRTANFWSHHIGNHAGSHNYFLDIAVQRGIVGETVLIGILASPVFLSGKKVFTREQRVYMGLVCAVILMYLIEPFISTEYLFIPIVYMLPAMLSDISFEFRKFRLKIVREVANDQ